MKVKDFITSLVENPKKALIFEYAYQVLIGTNYHITEVKNLTVESVDCGSVSHKWKETVIQLWENPLELGKLEYLSTDKALSILEKTHKFRPMELDSEIKIEYGNNVFHKSQLIVKKIVTHKRHIIVTLKTEPTKCKATNLSKPNDDNSCLDNFKCC